ncbi:Bro-N domain-containing protein [Streptomyces sp. NPDC059340]|uniref:BRO-N domain-containing protein n=1 Tax=Streptomyces sp. NPDC059340 TaxID=3346806 RepID=UPI0036836464
MLDVRAGCDRRQRLRVRGDGARVRRLTFAEGEHWFPAADVAKDLGYTNTRQALLWHVAEDCQQSLEDLARSVYGVDTSSKIAGHGLKKSMKMVNLQGLIRLVNGCTKPECEPFKAWVTEVVVTIQRDGCYELEPSSVQPAPGGGVAQVDLGVRNLSIRVLICMIPSRGGL